MNTAPGPGPSEPQLPAAPSTPTAPEPTGAEPMLPLDSAGNEASWVRAVRRNLHDDALRLRYADWLAECGDPRAEYLRAQVELKRSWSYADPCEALLARDAGTVFVSYCPSCRERPISPVRW